MPAHSRGTKLREAWPDSRLCQKLLESLGHFLCWGPNLGLTSERLVMQKSTTSTGPVCSSLWWESQTALGNQGGLPGGNTRTAARRGIGTVFAETQS